jgi:hypothetical protein
LPDLARACAAVASRAEELPAYADLGFAGYALTGAELLASIERAAASLGLAPGGGFRHGGLPWTVLKLAGLVVPMWREIAEMSYLWQVPHALDGTALEHAVGPLRATPLDVAMREALLALGLASSAKVAATSVATAKYQ